MNEEAWSLSRKFLIGVERRDDQQSAAGRKSSARHEMWKCAVP
jgi:hypothetical protein